MAPSWSPQGQLQTTSTVVARPQDSRSTCPPGTALHLPCAATTNLNRRPPPTFCVTPDARLQIFWGVRGDVEFSDTQSSGTGHVHHTLVGDAGGEGRRWRRKDARRSRVAPSRFSPAGRCRSRRRRDLDRRNVVGGGVWPADPHLVARGEGQAVLIGGTRLVASAGRRNDLRGHATPWVWNR